MQVLGTGEPYLGLKTYPDPLTLGVGDFVIGQNMRSENGIATVRNGMDRIVNEGTIVSASPDDSLWAVWFGYLGGTYRRLAAVDKTTYVGIYDLATGTEITAASGQWGNTRLTAASDTQYRPQFTLISDQLNNTTKLLVCNGVDDPRVIYHTGAAWVCAPHHSIPIPEANSNVPVYMAGNGTYLQLQSSANTTYTDVEPIPHAGNGVTGANDSNRYHPSTSGTADATYGNACKFTVATTAVSGDYSQVDTSTHGYITLNSARQVWLGIETAMIGWIDQFKIELVDKAGGGTTKKTLWDPTAPTASPKPIPVPVDGTNKVLLVFNTGKLTDSTNYDAVRFTYKGSNSPRQTEYFWLWCAAGSGTEPGQTLYAVSDYNPYSHSESPGVVLQEYRTVRFADIGAPQLDGLTVPNHSAIRFNPTITWTVPSSTYVNKGTSQHRVYSSMLGQKDFFLCYTHTSYAWGGAAWGALGVAGAMLVYGADGTSRNAGQLLIKVPDAYHLGIPTDSVAPVFSSGRLLVGAPSDSYERYDTLWVSEFGNPYRFRKTANISGGQPREEAAFTVNLAGESIKSSIATSTGARVGSANYIFTDSSVYTCSGMKFSSLAQLARVSPFGIQHWYAMAEFDGTVAWHGADNHIHVAAPGQQQIITYLNVEDKVDSLSSGMTPKWAVISMAFSRARLYVLYRTGTSASDPRGDRILVFDMRTQTWVGDDVLPAESLGWHLIGGQGTNNENALHLVATYSTKIKVYEYDSPHLTQDEQDAGNQDIAWKIRSRDRTLGVDVPRFTIGRIYAFCTKVASGTLSITRGYRPNGLTATSSISLSATPSELHKVDGTITCSDTTTEHQGAAAYVELSGTAPGGFQIFNCFAEVAERGDSAGS